MVEEILTIEEVAQILRVSMATVRTLIKQKKLKTFRVGIQVRVSRDELERYIREQQGM